MTLADLFLPAIETASEREHFSGYVSIESSAIDLYRRGLNVFPIPSPFELRELAQLAPIQFKADEKRPYILNPLFFSRMHLCNEFCFEKEQKSGKQCRGRAPGFQFEELFHKTNMAVMLGKTSRNLVCVDCDTTDSSNKVLDQFQERGLQYWAFQSSRGTNILFRVKEFEVKNNPKSGFSDVQIWGHEHYCVVPPSIHSSGEIYTWISGFSPFDVAWQSGGVPEISIHDLDWLGLRDIESSFASPSEIGLPSWVNKMSQNNQKILVSPIHEGQRNFVLSKLTYEIAAFIDQGIAPYGDGMGLLLRVADNCVPPYPHKNIEQMLKSALNKKNLTTSRQYYHSEDSGNDFYDRAIQFANSYDWSSQKRTGLLDKAIFVACCERSRMDHGEIFRASVRELAEIANVQSIKTVSRSLKRLRSKELIIFVDKTTTGAFQYRFGKKISANDYSNTTCSTNVVTSKHHKYQSQLTRDLVDDVFGKLGRVSRRTWEYLLDNPESTVASIARATKLNYHSIYKILPKLLGLEIVSYLRSEGVYIGEKLSDDKLFELSMKLGVNGKSDRKRTSYQIEREINVSIQIWKEQKRLQSLLEGTKKLN